MTQRYKEFKLRIIKCPKCQKDMIHASKDSLERISFHSSKYDKLKKQLEENDMVIRSNTTSDGSLIGFGEGSYLCENCEGLLELQCYNCKEKRLVKDMKFSYGDPPDSLCKQCYEIISAKKWKELKKEITENHRWDWD